MHVVYAYGCDDGLCLLLLPFTIAFWGRSNLSWCSLGWLDWLVREPPGSPCLHMPGLDCQAQISHVFWNSELKSSCVNSRRFSTNPLIGLLRYFLFLMMLQWDYHLWWELRSHEVYLRKANPLPETLPHTTEPLSLQTLFCTSGCILRLRNSIGTKTTLIASQSRGNLAKSSWDRKFHVGKGPMNKRHGLFTSLKIPDSLPFTTPHRLPCTVETQGDVALRSQRIFF